LFNFCSSDSGERIRFVSSFLFKSREWGFNQIIPNAEKYPGIVAECFPIYLVLAPIPASVFVCYEYVVLVLLLWGYFFLLPNLLAPRRHSYICCQVHSSLKNKKYIAYQKV